MARFTTDELVAASALLISGVISLAPNETLTSLHPTHTAYDPDHPKSGQESSLIARLGLSQEQQRMIRLAFERKRAQLKHLGEELDRQREELYNLRFQHTEQAERRLDTLAAQHIETRLNLHAQHAEMQQEIESILTPAQRNMAAHLRSDRRLPGPATVHACHAKPLQETRH
ncbi:MAG: hypothetical protein C0624_02390 [Desulfuromonas sp.]|nr:MAG: hypothetical protein C0624_02390 [Desulfuromonas sp.]